MMKSIWVLLFAGLVLVPACRKNSDETSYTEKGHIRGNQVEAALIGEVLSRQGNPISHAQVHVGDLSLETDERGVFIVPLRLMDDKGTLVRVSKSGYFSTCRFAFPHVGSTDYLQIQLLRKFPGTTLDADAGGTIVFGQGASVTVPADAIAGANGNGYLGAVTTYTTWLDPTDEETFRAMPGDLRALNADGYPQLLKTFGMVGIELESPAGEKLNLRAGKTARISFPVPSSMQAVAPATIPMWHFNTTNGYWEEEGTATLVGGDHYEGEVGHFSFWNVDISGNFVKLSMRFGDADGAPLSGLQVQLTSPSLGVGFSSTNNNGQVSGLVPTDEVLLLRVIDRCNKIVYEDNLGYFTTDTDLGKINVSGANVSRISGVLLDCNNEPLQYGLVSLVSSMDSVPSYAVADAAGAYSFPFLNCSGSTTVTITGYDTEMLKQSAPLTAILSNDNIQIGALGVCSTLDEYIYFSCNGYSKTFILYPSFMDGKMAAQMPAIPGITNDNFIVVMEFKDVFPNPYSANLSRLEVSTLEGTKLAAYGCNYCPNTTCLCAPTDATLIKFINYPSIPGEYAEGYVSGNTVSSQSNALVPFSLFFRLKKQ